MNKIRFFVISVFACALGSPVYADVASTAYVDAIVEGLAHVATSGSYTDLKDRPTIPTTTSDVTSGSTAALTSGGAYTALSKKYGSISTTGTGNVVTEVTSSDSALTFKKGNVQIPVGNASATTYADIYVTAL